MAHWTPFADWMRFECLDNNEGLTSSFALAYKITDDDTGEIWSARSQRLKAKDISAIFSAAVLLRDAVPQLVQALKLKVSDVVFIPALSSGETTAGGRNVMRAIGIKLNETTGIPLDSNALSKKVHNPIHGLYSASARDAELVA